MKGVVPAAGEGTRLRPLTSDVPKGLVEIAGQPLLSCVFETLLDAGVTDLIVVIGYKGDEITAEYGDSFRGIPITYVHQREQLGLGHAVQQAAPYIDGEFVVLNGDNVFADSINPAIAQFYELDVDATLLVEDVSLEAARETGVVETKSGSASRVAEKPTDPSSTLVTTGCYVLPEAIFHALELLQQSERGEYELSEAVNLLVQVGHTVEPVRYDGERINVNTPADIDRAEELFANRG